MSEVSERIWFLKFQISVLRRQVEAFRNGHKYQTLRNEYESVCRKKDYEIRRLKKELADAHAQIVTVRKNWSDIFDDLSKETERKVATEQKKTAEMEERALRAERQRDEALDKAKEWRTKYYEQSAKLEEAEGLIKKLTAQVNKDFQNSSIPSSQQGASRKRIPNSREKTERKVGGQPGHRGHRLMQRTPTIKHKLPDPEEYVKDPNYYKTGETVKRQKIILNVSVEVVEYEASVFRHRETGSRVHADFPEGYDTDISYDASVKAFAFLLANEGNVSAGKIKTILHEITKGKIDISEATINGLCREFSMKSEEEQDKNRSELMTSPVLNTDFTTSNVNGETKQVLIVASPLTNALMMIGRDSKGHNGIIGTPIETYVGTLVHDHDRTFYSYAIRHQECMQHNIRYLIGSIENEPNLKWNKRMHKLIKEMLHYRNSLAEEEDLDPKVVARFEKQYDKILALAKEEYEYEPPSEYYKEGYNLYLRLVRYKESELLFLHDKSVPANNSLAERLARVFKRKQKQAIVLRSNENFRALCNSISLIQTFRYQDEDNLFQRVAEIFARPKPTLIATQSV